MTLLEQFDASQVEKHIDVYDFRYVGTPEVSMIRRALAIAQAVDEWHSNSGGEGGFLLRRADELLEGK